MNKLIEFLNDKVSQISTAQDFLDLKCKPLISISFSDLLKYHKRDDSKNPDYFHSVYKQGGVYAIEFPNKIYIGYTGGVTSYFGRRWKTHKESKQTCLNILMTETNPDKIIFHALYISDSDSISRFIEAGLIAYLSKFAPELIVNCAESTDRKKRTVLQNSKKK